MVKDHSLESRRQAYLETKVYLTAVEKEFVRAQDKARQAEIEWKKEVEKFDHKWGVGE